MNFNSILGVYSVGWLSSGPVGVILSTMSNAFQVAYLIGEHFEKGLLSEQKPGYEYISKILKDKGIYFNILSFNKIFLTKNLILDTVIVDWKGWTEINRVEVERGLKYNKPREKIVDIDEMLQIGGKIK